ncbi:MAG: hypothetical protein H7337_06890 [Rhizobacter sp.]|nr:hypothetical protein [Rhizobacter sp.]
MPTLLRPGAPNMPVMGSGLAGVFAAQAAGFVVYGAVDSSAILAGAWFGPLRRPRAASKEVAMLAP